MEESAMQDRSMDVLEQTTSSTDRNSRLVSYDL